MERKDITPHVDEIRWDVSGDGVMDVACTVAHTGDRHHRDPSPERERLVMLGLREWVRDAEFQQTDMMRNPLTERWKSRAERSQREVEALRSQKRRRD